MAYTIYSSGDGAFLAEVLNSVAAIMGSDSMVMIAMIGVLLGTVSTVMSSIATGKFSLANPVLAIVMYLVLFAPRVNVVVYDVYSWTGRPVSNVPLGVAVAGMTLSHMGYEITDLFETAYTLPGMLNTGYGTPLEMLLSVRGGGVGTANSINDNDNLLQTLSNYVNDCTDTGIMLGSKNPAEMVKKPDVWAAIEFPSEIYTTKVYLGAPGGTLMTCSDAYAAIDNKWSGYLDAWNSYISGRYQVADANTVIQGALDSMVHMGLSSDEYMKNSLLASVIKHVANGDYSNGTYQAAAITTQAIEQARVQFSAESSMFARFARPLMTFVESFVYAIVPFMVFVIGFGMAGFKLLGRYVLILLWVQLWMPIMSVTNLFIDMAFAGSMDSLNTALSTAGDPLSPLSLLGMQVMQSEAADWVAVGGNLVAAAPALALTIIYGGAYTLVNLAHKLSPGDMINEQQAAPNLFTNPGVLSMNSQYQHDMTSGLIEAGAGSALGSTTLGNVAGNMLTSSKQQLATAQASYADTVSQSIGSMLGNRASLSELQSLGRNVSMDESTAFGHTLSTADKIAKDYGFDKSATETLKGALVATASGRVDGGALLSVLTAGIVSGGLSVDSRTENAGSGEEKQSLKDSLSQVLNEASKEDTQSSFRDTVAIAASDNTQQSFEKVASKQNQQAYSRSLQNLQQASSSYSEAQSLNASLGQNQSIPLAAMATSLAGNREAMTGLHNFLNTHLDLDREVNEQMGRLMDKQVFGDPRIEANEQRYTAAAATQVLATKMNDPEAQDKLRGMIYATGYVAPGTAPESVDATANKGIAGDAGDHADAVRQRVEGAAKEARADTQEAEGKADMAQWRSNGYIVTPEEFKAQGGKANWENRVESRTGMTGAVGDRALPVALQHLEQASPLPTGAHNYGLVTGMGLYGMNAFQKAFGDNPDDPSLQGKAQAAMSQLNSELESGERDPAAVTREIMANSTRTMRSLYEEGKTAGLSDVESGMYAESAVAASMGAIQTIPGMGAATRLADSAMEKLGFNTDMNYRDALHDRWYQPLYRQELERAGGDEELAHRIADAKFERIGEAGTAGNHGTAWLSSVAAVDMAQASIANAQPGANGQSGEGGAEVTVNSRTEGESGADSSSTVGMLGAPGAAGEASATGGLSVAGDLGDVSGSGAEGVTQASLTNTNGGELARGADGKSGATMRQGAGDNEKLAQRVAEATFQRLQEAGLVNVETATERVEDSAQAPDPKDPH